MSIISPNIFKAYDVRGEYPAEINEDVACATARATALFLNAKKVIVAMDMRDSSPKLKEAVLKGLIEEGADVIDIGVATTPMFYFAVNAENADGGIIITASHNPPRYNGLKITEKRARPIGKESGLLEIKKIVLENKFENNSKKGSLIAKSYLNAYVDFLLKGHKFPEINIVADAGCGPIGNVLNEIGKRITTAAISGLCFPPCAVFAHEANPLKDKNVVDLQEAVKEKKADLGVGFDGDGDRIFFFDSKGERIPTYSIASLLASEFLKENEGSSVISDVRMPKAFGEAVKANGGNIIQSRVGHAFIKKLLRENSAIFGAEVSGHYYFRDFFNADSGMYAFVKVMDIMAKSGKSLSDLTKQFLARFQSGELDYKVADKKAMITKLKDVFSDGAILELDRLTVEYPDWWFNVRPSNTEPFLRVNIEADTPKLLTEAKQKIENIIAE